MQHEALDKCRLLLFEDPALEAPPRHEVVVVWGETSQWPTIPSDLALVSLVYIALKIPWVRRLSYGTSDDVLYGIVWRC